MTELISDVIGEGKPADEVNDPVSDRKHSYEAFRCHVIRMFKSDEKGFRDHYVQTLIKLAVGIYPYSPKSSHQQREVFDAIPEALIERTADENDDWSPLMYAMFELSGHLRFMINELQRSTYP